MSRLVHRPRSWVVAGVAMAAGVAGLVGPGSSSAAVTSVPLAGPVSDQRAVALLRSAYDAGRTLAYAGTAFVGVGTSFVRVRLRHVPGQGTWVSPDDEQSHGAMLQPDGRPGHGGLGTDPLTLLRQRYRLVLGGTGEVAGRPVQVVRAVRPEGTLAATFSVDTATRLMLARSAFDPGGERYEQVMVTWLKVARVNPLDVATPGPMSAGEGSARTVTSGAGAAGRGTGAALVTGRSGDWNVQQTLPGGFELYDARVVPAGASAVLHLSYSDGLSSLSLFEQHGRLGQEALAGWRAVDLPGVAAERTVYSDGEFPQRYAWQGGDLVYALLGDAAPDRVAAAVASLPHGDPSDSVASRMRRGFRRLGSWIDPFA